MWIFGCNSKRCCHFRESWIGYTASWSTKATGIEKGKEKEQKLEKFKEEIKPSGITLNSLDDFECSLDDLNDLLNDLTVEKENTSSEHTQLERNKKSEKEKESDLHFKILQVDIDGEPGEKFESFPIFGLDFIPEDICDDGNSRNNSKKIDKKYKEIEDEMYDKMDCADNSEENWENEGYETGGLPHWSKTLKNFQNRVAIFPDQCVR